MKDEKTLHEVSDELLDDVTGGMFEEERQSYSEYLKRIDSMYRSGVIDIDYYDSIYEQVNAYVRYVKTLIYKKTYSEKILFDPNVDWVKLIR